MIIRSICREELDLFTAFTDQPERNERFRAYLTQMWDEGYIRPEWCFVAEVAGAFIGRVVYWTLPSLDNLFEAATTPLLGREAALAFLAEESD